MTSNHHAPYDLGYTHASCYNGQNKRAAKPRGEANPTNLFSVRIAVLQLDCVEAGIASNRGSACRGEYVPGPCTHRPSHHESL